MLMWVLNNPVNSSWVLFPRAFSFLSFLLFLECFILFGVMAYQVPTSSLLRGYLALHWKCSGTSSYYQNTSQVLYCAPEFEPLCLLAQSPTTNLGHLFFSIRECVTSHLKKNSSILKTWFSVSGLSNFEVGLVNKPPSLILDDVTLFKHNPVWTELWPFWSSVKCSVTSSCLELNV